MTDLLVASGGGHLHQLLHLAPRLEIQTTTAVWVSYDTAQARSVLGDSPFVAAHHPTTRNARNALRNYVLARGVLREHSVSRIVSTGAAVAVPFMLAGVRHGVPCYYVESATRVEGPSLSGRILEYLRPVHLYRQSGTWGSPRWLQGPSVFDGFQPIATDPRHIQKVFVSLGTHSFAFPRLLRMVRKVARDADLEVVWQVGGTLTPPGLTGRVERNLSATEVRTRVRWADVVVGHAGTGLALTCLTEGHVPVLVPRRHAAGEHADDHQEQLAAELDRKGLAVDVGGNELDLGHLRRAAALHASYVDPGPFPLPA